MCRMWTKGYALFDAGIGSYSMHVCAANLIINGTLHTAHLSVTSRRCGWKTTQRDPLSLVLKGTRD